MNRSDDDFRVIGADADGNLICQDDMTGERYNCGETREQFGEINLTVEEKAILDASVLG